MPTIIARLYPDTATARAVAADLTAAGMAAKDIDVIDAGAGADAIAAAGVSRKASAAYADRLSGGGALLVARAPFTPFGLAREAIRIADSRDHTRVADVNPNEYVADRMEASYVWNILRDHPRFMTNIEMAPGKIHHGPVISRVFNWPLLSSRKPAASSVYRGGKTFTGTRESLLSNRKPAPNSVFPGGKTFTGRLLSH